MKKTLLTLLSLISLSGFAQTVENFYVVNTANAAGVPYIVTSGTADQSASGTNTTWDFSALSATGEGTTTTYATTASQNVTYPNSSVVAESTGDYNGSGSSLTLKLFANATSITAIEMDDMVLNYSTNNATLGTFPLNYGYSNTDAVAGTFSAMGYNGTFTGTSVTSVDAYGTISANIGSVAGITVTRLKIVQTLNLIYLTVPIGTVNQTFYLYYQSGVTYPLARSIDFAASVPALNYNYDLQAVELYGELAGTDSFTKQLLTAYPNPATDVLHFSNNITLTKVTVVDTAGRTVLTGTGNDLNVSSLTTGVYYANAETDNGTKTIKFIKK